MATAEAEQLEDDHQSRDVTRQRFPEAGAVRQDQVGLEFGKAIIGNASVREQAEASVDAIDGLARGDDAIDRNGSVGNTLHGGVVEAPIGTLPELAQLIERDF